MVAAIHRNTANVHAHVAVNRVHPESHKAVPVFRDWLVLDRTCRQIEINQGWTHEKGPHRIEVTHGSEPQIVRHQREFSADSPAAPSTKARNFEAWNGRESFQSWLGKRPAQLLKLVLDQPDLNWQKVHKTLAAFNLEYRIKGSGAVIVDRTEPENLHAKASHLGRFASRGKLEARLGPFEGPAGAIAHTIGPSYRAELGSRAVRVQDPSKRNVLRRRFEQASSEYLKTCEVSWRRQRETEQVRYAQLRQYKQAVYERILRSNQRTHKRVLYSVAVIRAAIKREELRDEIRRERNRLRVDLAMQTTSSWRAWLVREADAGDTAAARELDRLRRRVSSDLKLGRTPLDTTTALGNGATLNAIFGNLRALGNASGVHFMDKHRVVFCDQGPRLVFHDMDDNGIKAGLALAKEKWGSGVYLSGTDTFREKTTAIAAQMGIRIRGGALQRHSPDLVQLAHIYGKPMCPSKLLQGRQYTGKLVATAIDAKGDSVAVIDWGRQLVMLGTDEKTVADLNGKVGALVRAHAGYHQVGDGGVRRLAWDINELQRAGLERGLSLGP